jgi:glyoxylase-like metal-dependent hydrolase (beta-lactamase superfamily II)
MKTSSFQALPDRDVHVIDLNFQGIPGAIGVYLVPHRHGAVLVESGPASTLPALDAGLLKYGFDKTEITDVLLTHIHLDHAGAAGWLAQMGAKIHVHKVGAPHLTDPTKLLSSASRLYGDQMERLWGKTLPVATEYLNVVESGQVIEIENLTFISVDTPGHAYHHNAYSLGGICFSGDVGGVRLRNLNHVRAPMVPPEFQPQIWRESLQHLRKLDLSWIAPTHFGFHNDPFWQLSVMDLFLKEIELWMEENMKDSPELEVLNERFLLWLDSRSKMDHLTPDEINANEAANPSWLSPLGIQRYWRKFRQDAAGE